MAGEHAVGGAAIFAGSLGTQVVKVFDLVAARTGVRDHEALSAGFKPATTQSSPDDHKAYYPTAHPITTRVTADKESGMLLGAQLVGWRTVASDGAGALAVLSGRVERSPGPLARASGLLARSAQGPRQEPAKAGYVPRGTFRSVAALMAQADLDQDTPVAWRLLLAELLRVAQAVHAAHLARSESQQAGRLAGEARKALEEATRRLGGLEVFRADLSAVIEAAQRGVGPGEEEAAKRRRRQADKGALRPEQFAGTTTRPAPPKRSSEVQR